MGVLALKIPEINNSYYDSIQALANESKIKSIIRPNFGAYIKNTAYLVNLPKELIEAFIFIESAGNPNASTKYATGLMQLSTASASDSLVTEKGAGRLSVQEENILKRYLGSRFSLLEKVKANQTSLGKTFVTKDDLLKPEFNILVGSILLKQLIDEFTENGKVRMDKVITIYNGGRYSSTAKKVIKYKGNTSQLLSELPKETSAYIVKLLGTNGLLDTLI
jgi:soluble lytic murein transglycosylase-like protein